MATAEESAAIREEARRRWIWLERKIARSGHDAAPDEVLEAEDLRRHWGFELDPRTASTPVPTTPARRDLELDWLRTLVASALRSNQTLTAALHQATEERHRRDRIVYTWLAIMSVLQSVVLVLLWILAQRLGG